MRHTGVGIPPGEYILDDAAKVQVHHQKRVTSLQIGRHVTVPVLTAAKTPTGWNITYQLKHKKMLSSLKKTAVS